MAPTKKPDGKPLRILSFGVENILRVVAVFVRPDGRVVELTGKNREGQSRSATMTASNMSSPAGSR
jgi:hypothetical protein